tara:strand:- start:3215 stop:3451 length:237 start_codon:yes stop_codon:yes gene_type:complete
MVSSPSPSKTRIIICTDFMFRVYRSVKVQASDWSLRGGRRTALQPSGVEVDLDALLHALEVGAGKHVAIGVVVHGHVL